MVMAWFSGPEKPQEAQRSDPKPVGRERTEARARRRPWAFIYILFIVIIVIIIIFIYIYTSIYYFSKEKVRQKALFFLPDN